MNPICRAGRFARVVILFLGLVAVSAAVADAIVITAPVTEPDTTVDCG